MSAGKRPASLAHGQLSTQGSDILSRDNGSITTERVLQAMSKAVGFTWEGRRKNEQVGEPSIIMTGLVLSPCKVSLWDILEV